MIKVKRPDVKYFPCSSEHSKPLAQSAAEGEEPHFFGGVELSGGHRVSVGTADERSRTSTGLPPQAPEACASASSATSANAGQAQLF